MPARARAETSVIRRPRARPAAARAWRAPRLCDRAVVVLTGSIGVLGRPSSVPGLRTEGEVGEVRIVMSRSAVQLVTPAALRVISGAPVCSISYEAGAPLPVGHIQISDGADVMIVMPATANIIGKAANGIADDAASSSILAAACPVVFVPSMNERMWRNAAVRRNIRTLIDDGHHIVPPVEGIEVATLRPALGAMPDSETILRSLRRVLRRKTA